MRWWDIRSPDQCGPGSNPTASKPYVGWVCCWLSPLLWKIFLYVLWFFPLLKNQTTTKNSNSNSNEESVWVLFVFIYFTVSWNLNKVFSGKTFLNWKKGIVVWTQRGTPVSRVLSSEKEERLQKVDDATAFQNTYPLDTVLPEAWPCPTFEQPRPGYGCSKAK